MERCEAVLRDDPAGVDRLLVIALGLREMLGPTDDRTSGRRAGRDAERKNKVEGKLSLLLTDGK